MARRTGIAKVLPRELEAGLAIVVLLRRNAVEPDQMPRQPLHSLGPQAPADALAAPLRHDDIQADEAEATLVGHRAQASCEAAIDFGDQEAAGVGLEEAMCVMQAGVPALARREIDRQVDFVTAHGSNGAVVHLHLIPQ